MSIRASASSSASSWRTPGRDRVDRRPVCHVLRATDLPRTCCGTVREGRVAIVFTGIVPFGHRLCDSCRASLEAGIAGRLEPLDPPLFRGRVLYVASELRKPAAFERERALGSGSDSANVGGTRREVDSDRDGMRRHA